MSRGAAPAGAPAAAPLSPVRPSSIFDSVLLVESVFEVREKDMPGERCSSLSTHHCKIAELRERGVEYTGSKLALRLALFRAVDVLGRKQKRAAPSPWGLLGSLPSNTDNNTVNEESTWTQRQRIPRRGIGRVVPK